MICFPNCKINIGLYIINKRQDGYHNLETVFYPLPKMRDILEIVPAVQTQLHFSGNEILGNFDDNLVIKAYRLIKNRYPKKVQELNIYLHKLIPTGAGLGGGSSDGTFMLRLLNEYFELQLSSDELIALSLQLGSDCPFFIKNSPQFATGRGEFLENILLDLSKYSIQLICPKVHISTSGVFQKITPKPSTFDLRTIDTFNIEEWKNVIKNDFEPIVFSNYPELSFIKETLYLQGAIYAAMSGSGSSIYGIFEKGKNAKVNSLMSFEEHYFE